MISKPLTDANRSELNDEIELYRAAGVQDVPVFGFFAPNDARREAIADLRLKYGHPVEKDGGIVLLTEEEFQKEQDRTSEVGVYDPSGNLHRTYSLQLHGENFRALAEQYVAKRPGWSLK